MSIAKNMAFPQKCVIDTNVPKVANYDVNLDNYPPNGMTVTKQHALQLNGLSRGAG